MTYGGKHDSQNNYLWFVSSCAIQEGMRDIEKGAISAGHISLASWLFLEGYLASTAMGQSVWFSISESNTFQSICGKGQSKKKKKNQISQKGTQKLQ